MADEAKTTGAADDRKRPGMAGLSAKQTRAVAALLTASSHAAAAQQAGVGERTLRRWLRDSVFRSAYRIRSRQLPDDVTGRLRAAAVDALDVLRGALADTNAQVRVRAATALLDFAVKVETDELAARLDALEQTYAFATKNQAR
jgi:hypothetical protein